jgi:predicted TIM-barrel fold metal-dependent hydrolase
VTERIISADSHLELKPEKILEHLPRQHHDAYLGAVAAMHRRILEGKPQKQLKNKPGGAAATSVGLPTEKPWEAAGRPGAYEPHARLADMDVDRVDAEVLYASATGGAELYEMDAEACLAAFQATNDAAIEFASVDPSRLVPVYILPLHDVECAMKEAQRIVNEGARAVQLPLYPSDVDLAPYWDSVYDPLWSTIEDLGIPISQHTGSNEYLFELMDRDPTPAKGIFQSLPSMYMAESLASWLLPGIFVRHPRLQVGFVEAGLGWLPYFITRLDRMSDRHGWEQLGMNLPEKPSHYWRQNMFATFEEDEFGVANRHEIGVENLLWATDYPHPDSTWPESQQVIHTHFDGVPVEEMQLMVGGNAARIYRL